LKAKPLRPWQVQWFSTATWTIEQAAYIMRGYDPRAAKMPISAESADSTSALYYWLLKECRQYHLQPIVPHKDIKKARFAPGTLMRWVNERGGTRRQMLPGLFESYLACWKSRPGRSSSNALAESFYQRAAQFIWAEHPTMPIAQVAKELVTLHVELEELCGCQVFLYKAENSIRGYLKGKGGSGKGGRPSKKSGAPAKVDLQSIAKKLISETDLMTKLP